MRARLQERAVYRLYDRDGRLLYVGLTSRLKRRLENHRHASQWFSDAVHLEFEVLGESIGQRLERHLIMTFAPLHNKAANVRRGWDYGCGSGLKYFPELDQFRVAA